jgi:hypothetical protein
MNLSSAQKPFELFAVTLRIVSSKVQELGMSFRVNFFELLDHSGSDGSVVSHCLPS